jgi:hypothetical protein
MLQPAPNDYLQRWPLSKRVNSSKADADDPTLIERVELASVSLVSRSSDASLAAPRSLRAITLPPPSRSVI